MPPSPHDRRVRVVTAWASERIQEIRIHVGDSLAVGHRNQQYPEFVWCATEDGHHGWVAEDAIEHVDAHSAVARRDFDSADLTAAVGEILDVKEQVGDFLLCQNATGISGWVPCAYIEEMDPGDAN